ncbi:MAG: 50S ribosomal protein L17 [bacterium]|nr:MAG: 50S ribosomal protein L17 [bacterium]
MRHRNKTKKLGRTKAHRKMTLQNLATAMVDHQQIRTTLAKAKVARSYVDKLITVAKKDTLAARRQAFKLLQNHRVVSKLFEEIAPTFKERSGGYTRVIKLGRRKGDGAELAILQLVGFEPVIVEEKKPSEKKKKAAPAKKEKEEKKAAPTEKEKAEEKPEKEEAAKKVDAKEEQPKEEKAEKKAKSADKGEKKAKEKATPKKKAKPESKAEKKVEAKDKSKPKSESANKKKSDDKKDKSE